ncbi:hypothetical protein LY78DRAFT_593654 [Colletotrichum sublineola]|nr:hypothetical protein LY78DRAFT_593654 [Colletotrichum sublineola]
MTRRDAETDVHKIAAGKRLGLPFVVKDCLLYHVRKDTQERLVIPNTHISMVMKMVHDDTNHFSRHRAAHMLDGFHFQQKTKYIQDYI